jgi:transposase-like protein
LFARELRRRRHRPTSRWHLDEAVLIAGRRFWLWRAVDDEGEALDLLVQRRRDKTAAVKLMRKLLKKHCFAPDVLVTRPFFVARSIRSRREGSLGIRTAEAPATGPLHCDTRLPIARRAVRRQRL